MRLHERETEANNLILLPPYVVEDVSGLKLTGTGCPWRKKGTQTDEETLS